MEAKKLPVAKVLKFAIPSLLGAALFLIPMKINGEFVLGVSILCDIIQGWMNPFVDMLALILLGTSAIVPILAKMAIAQIIYLSEIGVMMIRSKLDFNLGKIFLVFLERTLLSMPIIWIMTRLLIH